MVVFMVGPVGKKVSEDEVQKAIARVAEAKGQREGKTVVVPVAQAKEVRNRVLMRICAGVYEGLKAAAVAKNPQMKRELEGSQLATYFDPKAKGGHEVSA